MFQNSVLIVKKNGENEVKIGFVLFRTNTRQSAVSNQQTACVNELLGEEPNHCAC
jgi:hypothetical protein